MTGTTSPCEVVRIDDGQESAARDYVAREVALQVLLNGEPFSVIMRTPGLDRDLTLGFLFSESVISGPRDVVRVDVDEAANTVDVVLGDARARALPGMLASRREVTMNSSCGMCGRRTLESLELSAPPLDVHWQMPVQAVLGMPEALRVMQHAFGDTGGLHAAGLFDRDGQLEASAEDVGRHNAVDKLIGRMLLEGRLPLADSALFVSGRSSFEIVQKAFLGGVPFLAAVSAPSSLAIDLAKTAGITLLGFVRGDRFNIYAHGARVGR